MAFQAPLHMQGVLLPGQRHLVDPPVTGFAGDPFADVDSVMEVDVIGSVVNPIPFDGLILLHAGQQGIQHSGVPPQLRVAVHTDFRGRDAGEGFLFDGRVAIAAIDSNIADVVSMTEGNRLWLRDSDFGHIRRTHPSPQSANNGCDQEDHAENAHASDGIRARVKNLRHTVDLLMKGTGTAGTTGPGTDRREYEIVSVAEGKPQRFRELGPEFLNLRTGEKY